MSSLQPGNTAESLGRIILSTRRAQLFSRFMWGGNMVLIAASYLMLIWPVFMPAGFTNPAVVKVAGSERYRQMTDSLRQELKAWNEGLAQSTLQRDPPPDFMLLDVPWPGLVVEMNYRAVPRSDALSTGESAPNPLRYKYDPQIRVMPSVIGLIIFVTLEIAMALFMAFLFVHKSREQADFESGVLRRFFHDDETPVPLNNPGVERLLANFHTFAVQLNRRRGGRSGIVVKDEYDVQDVLHALLKLHFKDVRAEEQTPSHAGAAARMDFLLPDEQTVIEVKMTRDGLRDGKLGEELIVDVERYRGHPGCRRLICFVYDPEQRVVNPFGLAADLARASGDMSVEVIFSPAPSQA